MSRSMVRSLVVGLALVAAPAVVEAQSCTNTGAGSATCPIAATASLTIPHIVRLDIGSTTITLNTPTFDAAFLTDSTTAYTQTAITFNRMANRTFDVTIQAGAATFTNANGGNRAAGTVDWTIGGTCAVAGTALSTSVVNILDDAAAGSTTGQLCFRTQFTNDLSNGMMRAGAHTLAVTFTITAP
jgi:hypothetical protein